MATKPGLLWTEKLRQGDHHKIDGIDSWFKAAWESHRQFAGRFTTEGDHEATTINVQYANTRLLHAGILPDRIELKVKATQVAEEPAAYRASVLGDWAMHRNKIRQIVDRVELDGETKGVGVFYTTYQSPFASQIFQDEAGHSRKQGDDAPDPSIISELASIFPSPLGTQRLPRIKALDPLDVITDPDAVEPNDARWIAHRYYLTEREARELRKIGFYDAVTDGELKFEATLPSTQMLSGVDSGEAFADIARKRRTTLTELGVDREDGDTFERWEAWIVHDFQTNEIFHIMTGVEGYLRKPRPIPDWYRPYAFYRPNTTGDTIWTKPDSWIYLNAQKTLNRVTHAMVQATDYFGKGFIPVPESHAEDFSEIMAQLQPGECLPVPDEVATFWQKIGRASMEVGKVPQALAELQPLLERGIVQMSAVSEAAQGGLVKGVTATQSQISAGGQSLRSQYNRTILTQALGEVGEMVVRLLQRVFTEAQAIPIIGTEQASQWGLDSEVETGLGGDAFLNIDRQGIQGHFDFEVNVGDAAEQAKAEDKKLALEYAQLATAFVMPGSEGQQALFRWLGNQFDVPPEVAQAVGQQQPAPTAAGRGVEAPQTQPDQSTRQGTPSTAQAASQAQGASVRTA